MKNLEDVEQVRLALPSGWVWAWRQLLQLLSLLKAVTLQEILWLSGKLTLVVQDPDSFKRDLGTAFSKQI